MDQYPDENEEFEMQYQDELEMLEEFPPDDEENYNVPPSARLNSNNKSIAFSDKLDSLNSPQLSQIPGPNVTDIVTLANPVNRRLFGTPKVQRTASTPLADKQRLAPIQEVANMSTSNAVPATVATAELQNVGLRSKRRLEQDLFGDIADLYENDTYEDPIAKKSRTDEERDLEAIEKILEKRRNLREASNAIQKDNLTRLQALHSFKMKNLAYTVPQWPFLALQRSDQQRIYVRFHSEEYEKRAIDDVHAVTHYNCLLGEQKQQVWNAANEIILRKTEAATKEVVTEAPQPIVAVQENAERDKLWVEKYKPRKYIDLLSDEMTNRSLLYWLKMWDKVVFGKEFKTKQADTNTSALNSFNKRTGKFETNGGWRQRKTRQQLNTNIDELGRPIQKVALLCGPPGLGKTTLAHTIARHAGYSVREINASDDRSVEAFKLALENGTQMSSVLNEERRPNCIVLDEIDGAPRQSIEFLVKFVSDNVVNKTRTTKGAKSKHNILKRPIICICNDVYDPALRALRQIAFVVSFPPIDAARLAERLLQIARREKLKTDFGALIALAEKSGNDVRSCISTMQFFNGQKHALTLHDVLNKAFGQKDRHKGLFDVWTEIFRIQRPTKQLSMRGEDTATPEVTMSNMSVSTRARNVLDVVHTGGDYERLMQGVFENYLQQKMPDPNMDGIIEALNWFCFSDTLQRQISQFQNYTIYPYLQFGFVVWHLLFASLAWPKIHFPTRSFEFHQKSTTQKHIFQAFRKGISTHVIGVGRGTVLLVDTVPLLKRILSPQLRSVAVQLLSQKEQYDLKHTVEVMVDLGLTYTQTKTADNHYTFQMEPDIDLLCQFPDYPSVTLAYFGRQLIAREVELERLRRALPKYDANNAKKTKSSPANIPNHLQTLKPKRLEKRTNANVAKDVVSKDFFGRIQRKTAPTRMEEAQADPIVKSPVWYRFKEGFNNAVRKDVHMRELL